MSLVTITNVTKRYDPDIILDDISVAIAPGDRIGLIGRNGCGKTTLLKIISGMLTDFKGDVVLAKGAPYWIPKPGTGVGTRLHAPSGNAHGL